MRAVGCLDRCAGPRVGVTGVTGVIGATVTGVIGMRVHTARVGKRGQTAVWPGCMDWATLIDKVSGRGDGVHDSRRRSLATATAPARVSTPNLP